MKLLRLGDVEHIRHHEYSFLLAILDSKQGKLLDIGCAETNLSSYLTDLGFDVTGIDLVPVSGNFKFLKLDARKIPLPDESFDFIVLISTIEHIGFEGTPTQARLLDPDGDFKVIQEVYRLIKPTGTVIISFPFRSINHQANERSYDDARVGALLQNFAILSSAIFISPDNRNWKTEQTIVQDYPYAVKILELRKK